MHHEFWHERWADGRIGFHEPEPNGHLVRWFDALGLSSGQRVFLPLCGKTLDIGWLLARGFRVAGAELSELAIRDLFDELGVAPQVTEQGALKLYSTAELDVFVGDIFELNADALGHVDAVYDRAALVALPEAMRARYASHLMALTAGAPQLTVCFEYDQSEMPGPPFCVNAQEVRTLYAQNYRIEKLADDAVAGGLKGACPAREQVWQLLPKRPETAE